MAITFRITLKEISRRSIFQQGSRRFQKGGSDCFEKVALSHFGI